MKTLITILLCVVAFACFTLTAHAQAQRTFVSTSGSDANTASFCSTTSPCRSFTAAQTVTSAGGEIIALTSGGYGPVEITKSLQITAPTGVYVAITALPATAIGGTDAIRVNAGVNDIVVIRGLTLNNVGTANGNGITFPSGDRLYVENCVINGFDNYGISVERSSEANAELFVTDTTIRNGSTGTQDCGIFLRQTAGSGHLIRTTINNCQLERAGLIGLFTTDNTRTTVRNTVAARNTFGFIASATTGTTSELNLENCTATISQGSGIIVGETLFTGGVATARISNTASLNNGFAGIVINTNGTAHISDSTFNGSGVDGIHLQNAATAVVFVTFTTISGNSGKGLNRNGALSAATTIGSNRIFNNTGGSDAFSATIAQQ